MEAGRCCTGGQSYGFPGGHGRGSSGSGACHYCICGIVYGLADREDAGAGTDAETVCLRGFFGTCGFGQRSSERIQERDGTDPHCDGGSKAADEGNYSEYQAGSGKDRRNCRGRVCRNGGVG